MALERRQFIGLTTQESAQFDGLDREITVDTTNGTLRVHTEDSPHGNRLAKYSELDSVRGQINEVDDVLSNSLASETSARENADASLSSSIGVNTTAIDGLRTRLTTVENTLPNKQNKLVSGTNIKTINGNSLLGSGNIEIQGGGGGSQTSVITITVPVDPNNQTWQESHDLSSAASECRFTITSPLINYTKSYLPIVLFDSIDTDGDDLLKPFCQGWVISSTKEYVLSIFSGIPTRVDSADPSIVYHPTVWHNFKLILIEQTSGDISEVTRGLTNASEHYNIVLSDSLPDEPLEDTIYLIPEQ